MGRGAIIAVFAGFLGLGTLAGAPWGGAIQAACAAGDSRVPYPDIPRGKGELCVTETDFMLRNHMNLLGHQRDQTLREGIRGARFSLKGCVDCHAVPGADGTPVGAGDPRFFCTACHLYTAVRIDCFECHASRPEAPGQARAPDATGATGVLAMVGRDWK